jgi:hypothetical protein
MLKKRKTRQKIAFFQVSSTTKSPHLLISTTDFPFLTIRISTSTIPVGHQWVNRESALHARFVCCLVDVLAIPALLEKSVASVNLSK